MRSRMAVSILALTLTTMLGARSAEASPAPSQEQNDVITAALIARGVSAADAAVIANDPKTAAQVPVSTKVETSGEPLPASVAEALSAGSLAAGAIGTCSGSSNYTWVRVYEMNNFNAKLAYIQLQVNWCYNGARVTYAAASRSYYIYTIARPTWYFRSWSDLTQYFYTSGGHINGGVMNNTQAHFDICVFKYGCYQGADPYAEVRVYFNGTSLLSGRA